MKNKYLLFFFFILNIHISIQNELNTKYQYVEKFINVSLDHFNYATDKTFQLRYLINDTFEDKNGPILFYTGNEGDIELFAQNTGFIWETAPDLKALVVFAEHRYYGKSLPFGANKSFDSPEHFGYLTAEQALADYADLLTFLMKAKTNRPVIAIGGSYGGMLAAWFRMKYPHLVTGALAASAPVLQFPEITPCNIFSRIVTSVFNTAYNGYCVVNIKNSWDLFKNYSSTDNGRALLNKEFKFCKSLTKASNMDEFYDFLEDVYGNLAMANYPYDNNFLADLPAYPVRQFCGQLSKAYQGDELLKAMTEAISVYTNFTGKLRCLDYESAYQPSMGDAAWTLQTCTEMVMPMCSEKDSIFRVKEWSFQKFSDDCFKKYKCRPKENAIVVRFGGRNLGTATNIIFSNGLLDPWSGGGVLRSLNDRINIIIIPEGAHHIDLRGADPQDPASVRNARTAEVNIIKSWIEDFYFSF